MNKFAKIADGLAGWLTFEQRCGRYKLFSESYITSAVGQLLQYRYPGRRVFSEVEHPMLSELKDGPGKKPRLDFAVESSERGKYDLVLEIKWVSKSPTLLRDIVKDIVRLDLVLPTYASEAVIILVGKVKQIRSLFQDHALARETQLPTTYQPPSITGHNRNAIYFFHSLSQTRRDLYLKALQAFPNVQISRTIQLERSGPFPRVAITEQFEVYTWKVLPRGKKFYSENYEALSFEKLQQLSKHKPSSTK